MKKRGLASPDLADALPLTFAYSVVATDHTRPVFETVTAPDRRRALLRRKLPRAKIIVGLWLLTDEDALRREALQETGADLIATSLRDTFDGIIAVAREEAGDLMPARPTIVRAVPATV